MSSQHLRTKHIKMFVLDEADEMLNRGFKDQIYEIFRNMNGDTQVRKSGEKWYHPLFMLPSLGFSETHTLFTTPDPIH